jgi:hypothetical protein
LSTPLNSVDNSGGAPPLGTLTKPTEWGGAEARIIRLAARLTTTGTPTWQPSGSTALSTSEDPGFTGSIVDIDSIHTTSSDLTGSGMTASGAPSASAFFGQLAVSSDGTVLAPATVRFGYLLVTGHPRFNVNTVPANSTYVFGAVTLSSTPPTITDGDGFTWSTLVQEPLGADAYWTVWSATIDRACADSGENVTVSETIDSGVGFALAGTVA